MTSMETFWLIAGAMIVFALGFLLPPLLRRRAQQAPDETTAEIAVYRERLRELRAELRNGNLTEQQFTQARQELEEAMAADLATEPGPAMLKPKRHWVTAFVLILLTPSLAFLAYQQLGAGDKVAQVMATQQSSAQEMHDMRQAIEQLRARLITQPGNAEGWQMLGRSYLSINEFSKAAEALGRAYTLDKNNVSIILDYAEALASSQGRRLQGAPMKLVHSALEIAPQHPKALWFAAVSALQTGENEEAKGYLERLASQVPPGSEQERMVRAHLAQLSSGGGGVSPIGESGKSRATETPTTTASANQEEGQARVKVQVTLDPALKDEVSGDSTLFVFAQAAKGPPMPLAAVRRQVKDLPLTVVLDDSMAMMPSMKMSNFSEFKIGARISWSGNPIPQSGDYEGFAEGIIPANPSGPVSVVISQRVP